MAPNASPPAPSPIGSPLPGRGELVVATGGGSPDGRFAGFGRPAAGTERSCRAGVGAVGLSRVQEGEDREHASMIVGGFLDVELPEDGVHVLLDGSFRHEELVRDAGVRTAL